MLHALTRSPRACLTPHCRSPLQATTSSSRPRHCRQQLRVAALLKPAEGVAVTWGQTTDEVNIKVPVASSVKGRDVDFEVHPTRLRLAVGGDVLLEGSLTDAGAINVDSEWRGLTSGEGPCEGCVQRHDEGARLQCDELPQAYSTLGVFSLLLLLLTHLIRLFLGDGGGW